MISPPENRKVRLRAACADSSATPREQRARRRTPEHLWMCAETMALYGTVLVAGSLYTVSDAQGEMGISIV